MARLIYEWDEAKRVANEAKHSVAFEAVSRFSWRHAVVSVDARQDYGEVRLVAYGPIDGRLHALTFIPRGPIRRVISLRKANRREQATYLQELRRRGRRPSGAG